MKKYLLTSFFLTGCFLFFIALSSLLASGIGEGFGHTILSIIFFIVLPLTIFTFLTSGRRNRKLLVTSLWGILSWTVVIVLFTGARHSTTRAVLLHGGWPLKFIGLSQRNSGDKLLSKIMAKIPGEKPTPFIFKNGSIITKVLLKNGGKSGKYLLILDTGATISTISGKLASELGVIPTGKISSVKTAGGETSMPIGILESITVGSHTVSPFIVAICDHCSSQDSQGLIGLNFTRHFHISIDSTLGRINLDRIKKWVDRKDEIEPFIETTELTGDIQKDRLSIKGKITNHSNRKIVNLVFECTLLDENRNSIEKIRYTVSSINGGETRNIEINSSPDLKMHSMMWKLQRGFWN
ncbi:MAG: clan AA aspartic protease [Deltaproteobacteria bacterium]|nr:clan AA aspartic protease [Deltaproteobacteria bacterium]